MGMIVMLELDDPRIRVKPGALPSTRRLALD
jgi:hypothetical protein